MSSLTGEDLKITTDSNGSRSVTKDGERKHHKHKKEKKKDKKKDKKKHKHKHKDKDREKSKDDSVKDKESSPREESKDCDDSQTVLDKKTEVKDFKNTVKEVLSESELKVNNGTSEGSVNITKDVQNFSKQEKSEDTLNQVAKGPNVKLDILMPESLDDIPIPALPAKSKSDSSDLKKSVSAEKVILEKKCIVTNTTIEIENVPLPPPQPLDSIPIPNQINPQKKKMSTEKSPSVKPATEAVKIAALPAPPPPVPPPSEKPSISIPSPTNFQATIRESMLREVGKAETGLPQNIVDDFFKDFLATKMKQIESEYKLMTKQLALEGQKKEGDGVASSVEEMNKLLDEELSSIATATQQNDQKSSKWDSKEKSGSSSGSRLEVADGQTNVDSSGKPKVEVQIGTKKGGKLQMEFKITKTSADMISSGERIETKSLEEGEVSSSNNGSGSEDTDENGNVSETGSLSDSDKDSKSSKKKKKKKDKKKKKKHKSKDISESDSRSKRKHYHRSRSRSPKRKRLSMSQERSRSRSRSKDRSSTTKYIYDAYKYRDNVRDKYDRDRDRQYDRDRGRERLHHGDRGHRPRKSRSRSRSRSKSRERPFRVTPDLRCKIDKAKLREIAIKNAVAMAKSGQVPNIDLAALKSGGKSITELTDFCKRISSKAKNKVESSSSSEEDAEHKRDDDDEFIHHPFKVKDTNNIVLNIRDSKPLPLRTPAEKLQESATLRLQFPVSSGSTHRLKESEWVPVEKTTATATTTTPTVPTTTTATKTTKATDSVLMPPPPVPAPALLPVDAPLDPIRPEDRVFPEVPSTSMDIGSIISERLTAFKKLKENPNDIDAITILGKVQEKASLWAQSKNLPGKFLGSTGAHIMSQEELIGPDKKRQAWAKRRRKKETRAKKREFKQKYSIEVVKKIIYRSLNRRYYKPLKDQFVRAAPLQSGIGMALLQKMGWKQGTGLGKNNEGSIEPLALDFKTDRRGLTSTGEQAPKPFKGAAPVVKDLSGKHPVSALVELCNRRKWGAPSFELIHESGPDHKKNFLFKVIVNRTEYQPTIAMNNKKSAKAAAATCCLQELGLVPRDPPK